MVSVDELTPIYTKLTPNDAVFAAEIWIFAIAKEHHVHLPEIPTKGAILAEFFDA